jgi:hypothetical protein
MWVCEPTQKKTRIFLVEFTNFIVMTLMVMITTKGVCELYHLPLILIPNFRLLVLRLKPCRFSWHDWFQWNEAFKHLVACLGGGLTWHKISSHTVHCGTEKLNYISINRAEYEPTISSVQWFKVMLALDRAATKIIIYVLFCLCLIYLCGVCYYIWVTETYLKCPLISTGISVCC